MFLAARENDDVLDSYTPPDWILWVVDARPLPPPLEVTRRLEVRLSLGPPAELGRALEPAIALFEELPYLDQLRSLSGSPCCQM